jgi:hypothetical protein
MLRILIAIVQVFPIVLVVIAGALAILAFGREPIRSRSDRPAVIAIAGLIGLAGGTLVTLYVASFMGFDTGPRPEQFAQALPIGLAAAVLVALAGLAGYAVAARLMGGSLALVGAIVGPAVFIGLAFGASGLAGLASNAAYEADIAAQGAHVDERSAGLSLAASDVLATMSSDEIAVASVSLRATIHADRQVELETSGKSTWPRFAFVFGDGGRLDVEARPGDPTVLAANRDTAWDLRFVVPEASGTYGAPTAGMWTLEALFLDAAGEEYRLTTMVEVDGSR